MTKDEELAMDLALEALEFFKGLALIIEEIERAEEAITAIKQARSAPVQEPVAWMYQCTADNSGPVLLQHRTNWAESGTGLWIETPLYTTPPAAEWQKIECPICGDMAVATDIPAAQPAPVQPVGYEKYAAIREGHRNACEETYFAARPDLPLTTAMLKLFRDGFDRGYDAHGITKGQP